jgi:hypothetical protein
MVGYGVINVATAWRINVKRGPARCGTDLFSGLIGYLCQRHDGFEGAIVEQERFTLCRIIADGAYDPRQIAAGLSIYSSCTRINHRNLILGLSGGRAHYVFRTIIGSE